MKKVLMILLALAMVFSMAGMVSADDIAGESGDSGKVEVSHDIPDNCVAFGNPCKPYRAITQEDADLLR